MSDQRGSVQREDLRLEVSDEGPVLRIGDELEVLMRTVIEADDTTLSSSDDGVVVEVDGNEAPWWNVWTGDTDDAFASIQPEVRQVD